MKTTNMPGFTAERALFGNRWQSYAAAVNASHAFAAEIVPQGCILLDGQLVCDFPGLPVNKPGPEARCRVQCFRRFRGAALIRCLNEC